VTSDRAPKPHGLRDVRKRGKELFLQSLFHVTLNILFLQILLTGASAKACRPSWATGFDLLDAES